jgi:L-glyceraldehyde 3-phosphate reductase
LLDVLADEGVGCIAFSPLAQGLLTDKYLHCIPAGSRAAKPHGFLRPNQVTSEKLAQVTRLNALASARGQTLAQMALAWVLRQPQMTSVLIGASSVAQIEENVKTLEHPSISDGELTAIEAILAAG